MVNKKNLQNHIEAIVETEGGGSSEDESDDELMNFYGDLLEDDGGLRGLIAKTLAAKVEEKKEKKRRKALGNDFIFLRYGIGIQNYFVVQQRMIRLFGVLSFIAILQMLVYNYFKGYNYTKEESIYAQLSFGDMGYSGSACRRNFVDWSTENTRINLQCSGTTRIRRVISAGIVDVN